jgi:hypothetical protein
MNLDSHVVALVTTSAAALMLVLAGVRKSA